MQVIHDISPLLNRAAQGQTEAIQTGQDETERAVFAWAFGGTPQEREGMEVHSIKHVSALLYLSEFGNTGVMQ